MEQPLSDQPASRLRWIPAAASVGAIVVGCLVLICWRLDIHVLTSLSPRLVSMKANTAVAFILAGMSLWLARAESAGGWRQTTARVCAAIVVLIGLLTLSEYLFGWDLGIDQWLFHEHEVPAPRLIPGRMGSATALNFLLLGGALLLLDAKTDRDWQPVPYLVVIVAVSAFVTLVAYLYGADAVSRGFPFAGVAPHTAVVFAALSVGVLFVRARHRLACVISGETMTAASMRRLLLVAILLPVALGWVRLTGERFGLYGMEFGLALIVTFAVAGLTASIYWQAMSLIQAERYQRGINDVAVALSGTTDLEDTFPIFAATIKKIVSCDRICVVVRDGDKLVAVASFADPPLRCFQGKAWRSSTETAVDWVVTHQLPRLVRDLAVEQTFADEVFVAQEGVRSTLILPLLVGGQTVGSITFDSRMPGVYTQDHIPLLAGFVEPLASALRNVQLYAEVVRYARDLEGLVEERTQELQTANGHLVEASRHKSNFLANMSHELRTPLNSILGFADLLGEQIDDPLTSKQVRYVDHIQFSGRHLLALINDLLDLSKVEAGKLSLRPESFGIAEAIAAAVYEIQPLADTKQLTLALDVEAAPTTLIADPVRFKQIVYNLLSNAVKFTPEGGRITVTVRQVGCAQCPRRGVECAVDAASVGQLAVADTGIGIAAEDLPKLFTRFSRLETETTKQLQGSGLGLALTKQLVELHGGTIAVSSAGPGQGSAFTVCLPLTPDADSPDMGKGQ